MKRKLKLITLQSGCTDWHGRTVEGLFEVLLDEEDILNLMRRATKNKTRTSSHGPVVIRYKKTTKEQADIFVNYERKRTAVQSSAGLTPQQVVGSQGGL